MFLLSKRIVIAACALLLSACGIFSAPPTDYKGAKKGSIEAIYNEAKAEFESGTYSRAIELYEQVQSIDALSALGQQALLEMGYAQWRNGLAPEALVTLDRYIRQFPKNEGTAYALYLKGLILFNERSGVFAKVAGQDLTERDPKSLRESYEIFERIAREFPASPYAKEAQQRMKYAVQALAQGEVNIARYYLQRGAPVAAVNRAQEVIKQFPETPAMEEALAIMVLSYRDLNIDDLRADALRVLEKNFPNSKYLKPGAFKVESKNFFKLW